jgi:hypothetical protein
MSDRLRRLILAGAAGAALPGVAVVVGAQLEPTSKAMYLLAPIMAPALLVKVVMGEPRGMDDITWVGVMVFIVWAVWSAISWYVLGTRWCARLLQRWDARR